MAHSSLIHVSVVSSTLSTEQRYKQRNVGALGISVNLSIQHMLLV
jgi:hypothetical protein